MPENTSKSNPNFSRTKQLQLDGKNIQSGDVKVALPSNDPQQTTTATTPSTATMKKQLVETSDTPKEEHSSTFKLPKQALMNSDIKHTNDSSVLILANNSGSGQSPLHLPTTQLQHQQSTTSVATGVTPAGINHSESHPSVVHTNSNQLMNPTPNPSLINTTSTPTGGVNVSIGNTPAAPTPASGMQTPTILNKNTITNINKTLKAKQKVIHSREPHPKTLL